MYRDESKQGRPSTWILSGYVPTLPESEPLAQNLQAADQGKQAETGGYVPTPGDGTKPLSHITGEPLPDPFAVPLGHLADAFDFEEVDA